MPRGRKKRETKPAPFVPQLTENLLGGLQKKLESAQQAVAEAETMLRHAEEILAGRRARVKVVSEELRQAVQQIIG